MYCNRRSSDPLLRLFLDTYRVNLLQMPRSRVELGSVFAVRGRAVDNVPAGDILDADVPVFPDPDDPKDAIETVTQKSSGSLDMDTSASLVGRFLEALGLPGDEPSIKGALKGKGGYVSSVTIGNLLIRRIRRDRLSESLRGRAVRVGHPFATSDLYVCTGIWAAKALEMSVTSDTEGHVDADVALKPLVEVGGKLTVTRGNLAETIFRSEVPLVFGVELMRMKPTSEGIELRDYRPENYMRGPGDSSELALVEADSESAFLHFGA